MLKYRNVNIVFFSLAAVTVILAYFLSFSFWFALIPLFLRIAVLTYGSLTMSSQMHVESICQIDNKNGIVLTFDDGPIPGKTPQILEILKKYNAKGMFFCIGKRIEEHPEIFKQIIAEGHSVGGHSYDHGFWFSLQSVKKMRTEFEKTDQLIFELTDLKNVLFRPPYGVTNPKLKKALKGFNYKIIGWNIRSFDTLFHNEKSLEKRVLRKIKPGSIILFHDSAEAVCEVLEKVLIHCKNKGWEVVIAD